VGDQRDHASLPERPGDDVQLWGGRVGRSWVLMRRGREIRPRRIEVASAACELAQQEVAERA
jgi:hypothetical protein